MGVQPIPKLLFGMAVPMMISMLVQALYNVVDSIFVSRISEEALTAVGLAFPLQNLLISFGVGFGVGINALASRALGEKEPEKAALAAGNGLLLEILSYLIFLALGLFYSESFMLSQTKALEDAAQRALIVEYGVVYLRIVLIGSAGVFIQICMERYLQTTGRTAHAMWSQLLGAVTNIVFDPILIFGLLGFPAMGVAGAAVATIGGQFAGAALGVILHLKYNRRELPVTAASLRPNKETLWGICRVSIPSIAMSSIGSVMIFFLNRILMAFTATAAAVFTVYFKLQSFVFMPVFGLNNGMVPIIAYNYGAGRPERIKKTIKLGMVSASVMMLVGIAIFQLMPEQLLLLFDASEDMLAIGVPALRIISIHFIFAGICIICSSSCQAFGYGVYSLAISFARQLLVLLPVAWLLSLSGVLQYVWFAFPIAECVSISICIPLLLRVLKKTGMR